MSMFKKTCFSCGAKVDKLYEGICEDCVKEQYPPIYEIKPMNLKICNVTKTICYNNYYQEFDEIKKILPDIAKKHVVLNPQYELVSLQVENIEIIGNKLGFDINVECELKNE
ncbi:MAG: NMD3-related protein [Nanoarchaeota archaeon]|nr:NMD3-related protein [Nanoarchaeota archaeon]